MTESLYISLAKREKVKIRDSGSIIKENWPNEAFIQKNASVSAPPPPSADFPQLIWSSLPKKVWPVPLITEIIALILSSLC